MLDTNPQQRPTNIILVGVVEMIRLVAFEFLMSPSTVANVRCSEMEGWQCGFDGVGYCRISHEFDFTASPKSMATAVSMVPTVNKDARMDSSDNSP